MVDEEHGAQDGLIGDLDLAEYFFDGTIERRTVQQEAGILSDPCLVPVMDIEVRRPALCRAGQVLRDDDISVLLATLQHSRDLVVGEMLEDLADQAQVAGRQVIDGDVPARERDVRRPEFLRIVPDQVFNDIDPVVGESWPDQARADPEIPTPHIHDRGDPVRLDKLPDRLDIGFRDTGIGAGSGVERVAISPLPPKAATVDLGKDLADGLSFRLVPCAAIAGDPIFIEK